MSRQSNELAVYFETGGQNAETRRWLRDGAEKLERFDGAAARDRNLRSLDRKDFCRCLADPGRRACEERTLSGQSPAHGAR
jgi:hypothetical protein